LKPSRTFRVPPPEAETPDNPAPVTAPPAAAAPLAARPVPATPPAKRDRDPALDAEVQAWIEADPTRPRVAILGPVAVDAPGPVPDERPRFYGEIVVYLAAHGARGVPADQLDAAIWPDQEVKPTSRRVAIARARQWLGDAPDGQPWLSDVAADGRYRLRDGFLLDWHLFRRLRTRGESRGAAGAPDLRHALSLVRGAPLAGASTSYSSATRNPYTWLPTSEIQPHHVTAAVVDTAHQLVELCFAEGDLSGARWAVDQAWLADPDQASDIAWRDLLCVAAAGGDRAELDRLLGRLLRARNAEAPEDLDQETYRLICDLMPQRVRAAVR
jgi:hypothetical protein